MQQQNSPKAIGGLVCGVVSLAFLLIGLFVWFICFIGLAIGIVGLVLSTMARKEMPSSMATAGLITSIIGVSLCALIGVSCVICYCAVVNTYGNAVNSLNQWANAFD